MKKYFSIGLVTILILVGLFTLSNNVFADVQQQHIISDNTNILKNGGTAVDAWISRFWVISIPSSSAPWIWNSFYVTSPRDGEDETFTKTLTIGEDRIITSANITLAVDNFYRLEINGEEVIDRTAEQYKSSNYESLTISILR